MDRDYQLLAFHLTVPERHMAGDLVISVPANLLECANEIIPGDVPG